MVSVHGVPCARGRTCTWMPVLPLLCLHLHMLVLLAEMLPWMGFGHVRIVEMSASVFAMTASCCACQAASAPLS